MPAAAFGSEVFGVGPGCLKWMRSSAARLCPGGGRGVLQAAVLGLHGDHDPARRAIGGSITRYAEEIWLISDPGLWHTRHLSPGELYGGCKQLPRTNSTKIEL